MHGFAIQVMTAHILVTASNELGTRKRFKKPGSAVWLAQLSFHVNL